MGGAGSSCGRLSGAGLDHPVQVRRGVFDVKSLILTRPAFGGDNPAAVNFF
jgi:hypothetical protein